MTEKGPETGEGEDVDLQNIQDEEGGHMFQKMDVETLILARTEDDPLGHKSAQEMLSRAREGLMLEYGLTEEEAASATNTFPENIYRGIQSGNLVLEFDVPNHGKLALALPPDPLLWQWRQ